MRRRAIVFALLLGYLPACTTWHFEEGVSPQQLLAAKHPYLMRVTLPDRSRIVLEQPRITAGDSLSGLHNGAPFSVAASDVGCWVATRRISVGKTLGLAFAIPMVTAIIVAASGTPLAPY